MAYMTDEKICKRRFVQEELSALLYAATRGCVPEAYYELTPLGEEVVTIVWRPHPRKDPSRIAVNVTGDSPWAIVKDVMRLVSELYD